MRNTQEATPVYQNGAGGVGDPEGGIAILFLLLMAKILFVASLAGLYYLFSWNPLIGFFGLAFIFSLVVIWIQQPWKKTNPNQEKP